MGKCPFSFMHALASGNKNSDNPSSNSLDIMKQLDSSEDYFHTLEGRDEFNQQMRMIHLTDKDLHLLRKVKPIVERNIDFITDRFYNSVLGVNKLEAIILENSSIERLKKTLREHIIEIFDGNVDEQYIFKRLTIANIHKKIGLEPKWYLSAFQNLQNVFIHVIYNETINDNDRLEVVQTITKLLNLEQQLVLEEYEKENIREKEAQYQKAKNEIKQKIAEFSSELIDFSVNTNAAVKTLVASSNEVSDTFQRTTSTALESQGMASNGYEHLSVLTGNINHIYLSTSEMERSINELSRSSKQIQKIVTAVQEIADQTKILSLNATIEAARAGEHGRGFSVVAQEVNRLAEDTKNTVIRIEDLTNKSSNLTDQVVEEIRKVQALTKSGKQQSIETSLLFTDIVDSMKRSTQEIVIVEEEIGVLIQTIKGIGDATAQTADSAVSFKLATDSI